MIAKTSPVNVDQCMIKHHKILYKNNIISKYGVGSVMKYLVALAVSLDGNGIKFGLGDDSNLSVEVDAKIIYYSLKEIFRKLKIVFTYSPVITTSGD